MLPVHLISDVRIATSPDKIYFVSKPIRAEHESRLGEHVFRLFRMRQTLLSEAYGGMLYAIADTKKTNPCFAGQAYIAVNGGLTPSV